MSNVPAAPANAAGTPLPANNKRRRRKKRGGGGGGGGGGGVGSKIKNTGTSGGTKAPRQDKKKKTGPKGNRGGKSCSRLSDRLGSSRQDRLEWNSAVQALRKVTLRAPFAATPAADVDDDEDDAGGKGSVATAASAAADGVAWMLPEVRLFASTIEQLAAIRFPSRAFRTGECAELATAVAITFEKIQALLPPAHAQTRSSAEACRVLVSTFPVYCHFLRSVTSEQMESFTSSQLATILGFFTPYASSQSRSQQRVAALALHTLTKVLSSNAERCTQHYSELLKLLDGHIRSKAPSPDKDPAESGATATTTTTTTTLYGAGNETVRCAAMDCLSGLCAGTSRTATTKIAMGENAIARSLFGPLCDVLTSFVRKAAERAKRLQTLKESKLARREAIKGKAGGAWTALADDGEGSESDDGSSNSDDGSDNNSGDAKDRLTGPEIFACTSAARALRGLVSVLPKLPSSRSKELLSNLHVLSAFGIDGTGQRGETVLASAAIPHASAPQLQTWRKNGVFRKQQRQARFAAAVGMTSGGSQQSGNGGGGRMSDSDSDSCNSASDTEASDAEGSATIVTLFSRLRLQALSCLQCVAISHHALVHTRWTDLIADSETEWKWQGLSSKKGGLKTKSESGDLPKKQSKQPKQLNFSSRQTYRAQKAAAAAKHAANKRATASRTARSLIATVIWDKSSKVRATAASIIGLMLESAPFNQWITPSRSAAAVSVSAGGGSVSNSAIRTARSPGRSGGFTSSSRSFIPMTTRIANSIVALHGGLFYALRRERQTSVVEHLLKCVSTLFRRLPYENMGAPAQHRLAQFIPEIMRIMGTALLSRGGINQIVCTGAMTALINAVGTSHPLDAVRSLLLNGINTRDSTKNKPRTHDTADAQVLSKQEEKQPALTPPRLRGGARRGISKGSGAGGDSVGNATGVDCLPMFCPVPAVVSDSVSHRPADVLYQVLQHCGGGKLTGQGKEAWPSYSNLPPLALRVLHRMAKTYPRVVLSLWRAQVSLTLSTCVTHPTDNLQRATALGILGVLLQASSNDALNYVKNPINNVSSAAGSGLGSTTDSIAPYRSAANLYAFVAEFLPRCFNDPDVKVRGMACSVLTQVQRPEWQCIDAVSRAMFFRSILHACNDMNVRVQNAACLALGTVCTLPYFYEEDVQAFVVPAVKVLLRLMCGTRGEGDNAVPFSLPVRSRAAWAMANLCDVAGPVGNEGRPLSACPLAVLGRSSNGGHLQIITNACIDASRETAQASSHAIRLRSSGVRALGSVAQYWLSRVGEIMSASAGDPEEWMRLSSRSPAPDMLSHIMEQTISTFDTAEGLDKVLWNACHAAGRVLAAIGQYDEEMPPKVPSKGRKKKERAGAAATAAGKSKRTSWADDEDHDGAGREDTTAVAVICTAAAPTVANEHEAKDQKPVKRSDNYILTGVGARFIVSLPWYLNLLRKLSQAVESSAFKVRLNAVQALARRKGRRDYGTSPELLAEVFSRVVRALRTLDEAHEQNFELRFSLKHALEELVCHFLAMIDSEQAEIDDLGHGGMKKVFVEEAAFLLELLVKRERSSGIGMIKGDAQALSDPENGTIVEEAQAVRVLYAKLTSQMCRSQVAAGIVEKVRACYEDLGGILGDPSRVLILGKEREATKEEE